MKKLTVQSPRRGQSFNEWQQEWADVLIGRDAFEAASASGSGYSDKTRKLPAEWVADYHHTADHPASFVVYSWGTPIAWVRSDGDWVIPSVKYSISTARAQSRIASVLGHMGKRFYGHPLRELPAH